VPSVVKRQQDDLKKRKEIQIANALEKERLEELRAQEALINVREDKPTRTHKQWLQD
jgi:hypothetical protein